MDVEIIEVEEFYTMIRIFYAIALLFYITVVFSQTDNEPICHLSFDVPQKSKVMKAIDDVSSSQYKQSAFVTTFGKGIKGQAMKLTDEVPLRIPEFLEENARPGYGADQSFSLQLWVQTKKNAPQGTPVMSNKKSDGSGSGGWILGTKENGAWYWQVSDGKVQYAYEPTAQRQAINDGDWHQLTVAVDRQRQEMWMYLDGRNVAIYRIEELGSLESGLRTVIGGSDEYNDWGSRGEWVTFNGKIDEVKIWNRVVTSQEVAEDYRANVSVKVPPVSEPVIDRLKVQVWNIWHGGHRYGQHVGVTRVIDVLKRENADIIGLIETYGSGAIIADSLGYYFYLISSNLSIMSRYPIEECIGLFKPFFSGGAIINLGNNRKLAFFDIWLNYSPDVCELRKGEELIKQILRKEKNTRLTEINTILKEIEAYTRNADKTPVIMAGDFNCGSHLDWTTDNKGLHDGMVIEWPVSQSILNAGFKDSFRQLHPNVLKAPGFTWSPLINPLEPDCIYDRIDFIYYKGRNLVPFRSETIDHHPVFWPSDHGSVITWFYLTDPV